MKHLFAIGLAIITTFSFTGCSQSTKLKSTLTENTLSFENDNTFKYYMFSEFNKDYYSASDLNAFIRADLGDLSDSITCEVSQENDKVKVIFSASDLNMLNEYLDTSFNVGSVSNLDTKEYPNDIEMYSIDKNISLTLNNEDLSDMNLVVWNTKEQLLFSEKIKYHSQNIIITDKHIAKPINNKKGPYYIVY